MAVYLDLNIVPIPSSVKSSIRMEWGTRPSMIKAFFTPWRRAWVMESIFGIIPPLMIPSAISAGVSEIYTR